MAAKELTDLLGPSNRSVRMLLVVGMLPVVTLIGLRLQLSRPDYDVGRLPATTLNAFLYTGVLPLNFGMAMAAGSFASEFESGTIVPLLATPARTTHIFIGKLLAALAGSIGMAWFSQGLLLGLFGLLVHRPWPLGESLTGVIAAGVPVLGFPLMAFSMVLGSRARRVTTAQANGTLAFLAVVAVVLLLSWRRPPVTPALIGTVLVGWMAGGVALLAIGIRRWNREELLSK